MWVDSSTLEEHEIVLEDDGATTLILEEEDPPSYHAAKTSLERLRWDGQRVSIVGGQQDLGVGQAF